jgi:hypothetical protein
MNSHHHSYKKDIKRRPVLSHISIFVFDRTMTLTSSSRPWVSEPACPLMDVSHTSSFSISTPPALSAPASRVNKEKQFKNFLFYVSTASIVNPVLEGQITKKPFFVPTASVGGESKSGKATKISGKKEKI